MWEDDAGLRRPGLEDTGRAVGQAAFRVLRERMRHVPPRRPEGGRPRIGFCPVCRRTAVLVPFTPWLRDSYECFRCGSIPRQRALMLVLEAVAPGWRGLRIHESSPDGASSRRLALACPAYDASQFWPDVPRGSARDGVRCEDVSALTFPDGSLDLFITQDVFEHVIEPERGFAEIARVLRPGGLHVFTVPFYGWTSTVVRARPGADGIEHLQPPDHHRNPIDPAGSLVATEWGWELPDVILRHGGMATTIHAIHDPARGIVGAFPEVMVSRKPTDPQR